MALSLSTSLYAAAAALLFGLSQATDRVYDFNITWVNRNPDNAAERPVIGINGQWPIPQITADVGDRVIVNMQNQLGNETTSIHFHGLYQNGTTHMDGTIGASQCGVSPGSSITYNFTVDQPGTYWYHSHERGQYPDGFRGPLIVNDPQSPYLGQYDEERIFTLSDWYHDEMPGLISGFLNVKNPTGAEPVPDNALMNEARDVDINIDPGKTYLFRIINMGAFAAQYLWFEGHTMRIVEVDGIYTDPAETDMLYITVAQRYSVLVTTRNDTGANFPIVGSMDQDLFDTVPATLNPNVTGWLVYDTAKDRPAAQLIDEFAPYDDFNLVPQDKQALLDDVDHQVILDMKMDNLGDGKNYAFFNDVTYVRPKVPTLYSVMSTGDMATNVAVYGVNSNSFVLNYGDVVELVLNSADPGKHPFHLHGHDFQVVARADEDAGVYDPNNVTFPDTPMRRDTLLVNPNSYFVIRFRANNPGVWLFHCHIEWHVDSGLIATMVEAPLELQQSLTIPEDHWQACRDSGEPYQGNAAGNKVDLLDLKGNNVSPKPLPAGFTAGGIVALVFSCISAFLGMVVISWYGAAPIGQSEAAAARRRIAKAGVS